MNKETVSIIGIVSNLVLGFFKLILGALAKSSALVAEGLHSIIDVVSSLITFFGIKVAKRKPSKIHPYGWARAEVLAGFLVTLLVLASGIGILREAYQKMTEGKYEAEITLLPLLVMMLSIIIQEAVTRLKIKIGEQEESLALIADAKHSRVDVLSSSGVLLGLVLIRFFPIADSLTALLIGLYILYEAIVMGKEIGENLLDVADLQTEKEIKKICQEEQVNLSRIRTRKIGALTSAELEISLPTEVKISRADELIQELQETLIKKIPCLEYVIIQIKGVGKRLKMLRRKCGETIEIIGPKKVGWRIITPFRNNKSYKDFGAPEYLVIDSRNGEKILREIIKNPYYKIGRGHGVRFARAVQADEVRTQNIGENAKNALGKLKIKLTLS